jgi:hypothetical protein
VVDFGIALVTLLGKLFDGNVNSRCPRKIPVF